MTRLALPVFVLACLLACAAVDWYAGAFNHAPKKNVIPAGYPNQRIYLV